MRRFKRIALAALVLLLVLLIVAFTLENLEPVSLVFLGWSSAHMPIAAHVLLALLAGMVIGPLLTWFFGRKADRLISGDG